MTHPPSFTLCHRDELPWLLSEWVFNAYAEGSSKKARNRYFYKILKTDRPFITLRRTTSSRFRWEVEVNLLLKKMSEAGATIIAKILTQYSCETSPIYASCNTFCVRYKMAGQALDVANELTKLNDDCFEIYIKV